MLLVCKRKVHTNTVFPVLLWLKLYVHRCMSGLLTSSNVFFPLGVYSEDYDPALAHCNMTVWNPLGNGLSYEEYDFPIFSLKDDNDTQVIRQVPLQRYSLYLQQSLCFYPLNSFVLIILLYCTSLLS